MSFIESDEERERRIAWMRKREQDCIARGWKRGNKTGSGVIISPRLCEKLKQAEEERTQESKADGEKNK